MPQLKILFLFTQQNNRNATATYYVIGGNASSAFPLVSLITACDAMPQLKA